MKGLFWIVLALLLATGPGCMMMPKNWFEARGTKADPEPPPPPPVVMVDDITESNYPKQFEKLCAEVDYAETHTPDPITVHTCDGVK